MGTIKDINRWTLSQLIGPKSVLNCHKKLPKCYRLMSSTVHREKITRPFWVNAIKFQFETWKRTILILDYVNSNAKISTYLFERLKSMLPRPYCVGIEVYNSIQYNSYKLPTWNFWCQTNFFDLCPLINNIVGSNLNWYIFDVVKIDNTKNS